MGNSKQRKAGEMSGGKLRNHSFQEKKGRKPVMQSTGGGS